MRERYALCFLCILGFLKEFRPSESFLTQYLVGPVKNFTQEEVNQEIYPLGTYSTLLLLIVVFLITDALCYKPVIILHSLSGVVCCCLITFGSSKSYVQFAELFYGLFVASEVAYSTYMYASCEKQDYQRVTSYTRIALQSGRLFSGFVGQLLISSKLVNFHELNFLSLTGLSLSLACGFLLPPTHQSLYFHQVINASEMKTSSDPSLKRKYDGNSEPFTNVSLMQHGGDSENTKIQDHTTIPMNNEEQKELSGFQKIWDEFISSFSSMYVVKWSLWWSCTQCGYLQVTSYVQNLWQDTVNESGGHLYNGAASATYTIFGIMASWTVGQLKIDLDEKKSHWLLFTCAVLSGALVIFSAITHSLIFQYVSYGFFKILYQVMMIFANTEVAKSLTRDTHGLVFGFNTFIALVMQTILTIIVTGKGGLQLSTRLQFFVYGGFFIVIGFSYGVLASFIRLKEFFHPVGLRSHSPDL